MPYIVRVSDTKIIDFSDQNFDYEYPNQLDLKPGSEIHNKIVNLILDRARSSRNVTSRRFSSWREIDRTLTIYIEPTAYETALKQKDSSKPISIVFPYSYSVLETLLTYLCMAFFQDPIFRFDGVSPEDEMGAKMLELVIQLHVIRSKMALALHTIFRDSLAYGAGIGIPSWKVKYGKKMRKSPAALYGPNGMKVSKDGMEAYDAVLFEGNTLYNVDPYSYLPDTQVGIHDVQESEYVGWLDRDNLMNLLKQEAIDQDLFNIKYLKKLSDKKSFLTLDQSDRERKVGGQPLEDTTATNKVDVIWMTVELIPKDYELSENTYPEKWYFGLAADCVVIKARPASYNHNMFNVAIAAPDYDGYSSTPMSRLETLYGLQHTLDWLFNSHITNVRKAINDMLVVDPYMVNILDLKTPEPGKLIRLRRPAWGRGVEKWVQQLNVTDVTQSHIKDSMYITNWMERVAATDQSMMGVQRQGGPERLTGTEFEGTRSSATSRLQRISTVIGLQLFQDLGYMLASQTQQLMTQDVYASAVGRWEEDLMRILKPKAKNGKVKVSPFDLAIDYDVIVRDGSIPGWNFSKAWIDMFQVIGKTPELAAQFDVFRLFAYIAKQLGAKNIEDFRKIETSTSPDEQVLRQAERGNLIPAQALGGTR